MISEPTTPKSITFEQDQRHKVSTWPSCQSAVHNAGEEHLAHEGSTVWIIPSRTDPTGTRWIDICCDSMIVGAIAQGNVQELSEMWEDHQKKYDAEGAISVNC